MPAAAVIGSAVIGGIASKSAARSQAKGTQKGLDQSAALAQQARDDVNRLFARSSQVRQMGMKGAMDFYKTAAPTRMSPFLQANQQAQNVIGQGAVQANNAILGLPVDMGFTQQAQVQPDASYMASAELPVYPGVQPAAPAAAQPVAPGASPMQQAIRRSVGLMA